MEDGEETSRTPERPKLGAHSPSPGESQPEPYGHEYYAMNTAQKLASSKPDRDRVSLPKARGGWTMFILLIAAGAYIYWKPYTISSAFEKMKSWVLNQRQEIFSERGGYGELPKDEE